MENLCILFVKSHALFLFSRRVLDFNFDKNTEVHLSDGIVIEQNRDTHTSTHTL